MIKKFTPHFRGQEDDLKQEMLIAMIVAIRRIRRNEIHSIQNYLITTMKYAAYKMAKKVIEYDRRTVFLNDFRYKYSDETLEWQNLFDLGCFSYEAILSSFETFEERLMVMNIMEKEGYSKRFIRNKLKCCWGYIEELEKRTKEKLLELIKILT
jgi:hypothetical protein